MLCIPLKFYYVTGFVRDDGKKDMTIKGLNSLFFVYVCMYVACVYINKIML